MSGVSLSSVTTLAKDYESNKIKAITSSKPHYPSSAILNERVSLIRTDLTTLSTTCIVNAANTSLLGGGGVDGAIHRAAGPGLLQECRTLNGCETGSAKITKGYNLPAKHVIHAVGPVYRDRTEEARLASEKKLRGCYRTALELAAVVAADGNGEGASIAFSAISTGVYGYPSTDAAHVALRTVREFLDEEQRKGTNNISRVVFCNFLEKDETAYEESVPLYFPSP